MILSASYNLFDGEELLEGSISQIRKHVDFLTVVYQEVSNYNNKKEKSVNHQLENLKKRGLIDDYFLFVPKLWRSPSTNEKAKRNLGLSIAKKMGATHFISLDTDEFFDENQLIYLKDLMVRNGYDSSYSQMQTFYKSWEYIIDPPEDYYVPLIFKITKEKFRGFKFQVLTDPTRNMRSENPLILKRDEFEMMHGSYIRNDIAAKLNNSSANKNFKEKTQKIINHFNQWEFPQQALLAGTEDRYYDVKESKYQPLPILNQYQNSYNKNDEALKRFHNFVRLHNAYKTIINALYINILGKSKS